MMDVHEIACLNARLPLRLDWKNRLCRVLGVDREWLRVTPVLADFARDFAIPWDGLLTPELRLALIRQYPELGIQLLGDHLERRFLFDTSDETRVYDTCESWVRAHDARTFEMPFVPQVLAIRGAVLQADGGVFQTDSAHQFSEMPFGERAHFSSQKTPCFDTVFVLFWKDPQKHARIFEGTSNPNMIWPEGTAHLCDGQYTFQLGRHRTSSRPHIDAVLSHTAQWPEEWIFERGDAYVRDIALEGVSPVNVIRSHDEFLDLSKEDIQRAERGFAEHDPRFTATQRIKINIHTCPATEPSSLGCQNIHPDQYADWIMQISWLEERSREAYGFASETWYTLIDASKI